MLTVRRVRKDTKHSKGSPSTVDCKMELTLNEQGMICDCDIPTNNLFGYRRSELAWRHISDLLPELAGIKLMCNGQINPRLSFLSRIGHRFQLVGISGNHFEGRFFIRVLESQDRFDLRAMIFPYVGQPDSAGISW